MSTCDTIICGWDIGLVIFSFITYYIFILIGLILGYYLWGRKK